MTVGAASAVARRASGRLRIKRCIDLSVALAALALLAPLLAIIAVLIRVDSRGPSLFRQTRVGRHGRRFEMLKFRTMEHGAADDLHRAFVLPLVRGIDAPRAIHKLTRDPRITRVGRWLRRTSLDELPQLFNVVRGEMSLVGPRPATTYEYDAYDAWQLERLDVPQGITGLWQVSGRSRLSYRRMHELDIEYVRTWSLRLDAEILIRTARAVLLDTESAV